MRTVEVVFTPRAITRADSIVVSRGVIVVLVAFTLASYFWNPVGLFQHAVDLFLRAYLHFVGGAMAHEGSHGNLGNTRRANFWWGRLALVPSTVPYVTFSRTHLAHHSNTNEPENDPDAFLHTPHAWQVPLRILAMPHQWLFWLKRHGKLTRAVLVEYLLTYVALFTLYGTLAAVVGPARVLTGLFGSAILHSFLLWVPFAMKTHEGYSVGTAHQRSHNYYGRLAFFFSFGLSLHREHHLKPRLGWLQMLPLVEPCTWWQALTFRRDVRPSA